jgi:hypothetical protein
MGYIRSGPSFGFAVCKVNAIHLVRALGSVTSFSTCIATALLLLHQRISLFPLSELSSTPDEQTHDPRHVHECHERRRALPRQLSEKVCSVVLLHIADQAANGIVEWKQFDGKTLVSIETKGLVAGVAAKKLAVSFLFCSMSVLVQGV